MTESTTALANELAVIQNEFKGFRALQKQTRKEEATAIAKIYMWWRNARTEPGYLENCYASAHIASPKNELAKLDFKPLLLLVNNKQITQGDLWQWNIGLNCIHEAFERNPAHYVNDPTYKIQQLILNSGGKSGLAFKKLGEKSSTSNGQNADPLKAFELDDCEFGETFTNEAKLFVTAKSNKLPVSLPALPVTQNGFSVVLVQNGTNGAELIGSSNDEQVVGKLLVDLYRNDFEATPLTMRCVIEPLHILNLPNNIAAIYSKHIARRKQGAKKNAAGGKASAFKRLIYRPHTSDFLLSSTKCDASAVVIAKPKQLLIDRKQGDIWMPISLRKSIETNLLHKAMCNMYVPSHDDLYTSCSEDALISHVVYLSTKLNVGDEGGVNAAQLIGKTKNLHHPPLHFLPFFNFLGVPEAQVVAMPCDFAPSWKTELDVCWLRATVTNFIGQWLQTYVKKAEQAKHKTMQVEFSEKQMVMSYEYNPEVGHEIAEPFALPPGCATGNVTLKVRALEFLCFLRQISDLSIVGSIKIDADTYAIRITFSTTASDYVCWIPAANADGVRDATHFALYSPVQTEHDSGLDDQDPDSDLVEEELALNVI